MAKKRIQRKRKTLERHLRDAVTESGLSQYRIAKDTGISQPVVTRFANGTRSISIDTADRLMEYFGLEITPKKK